MICRCGKQASQSHHKFPQTKRNRILYGDLIDHRLNREPACADCHVSHRSPHLTHWSEAQFCRAFGIEMRSKTARFKEALRLMNRREI